MYVCGINESQIPVKQTSVEGVDIYMKDDIIPQKNSFFKNLPNNPASQHIVCEKNHSGEL